MAWIESHDTLAEHPKTKRLARLLGVSRPAAIGHLHLLWWWAMKYAQDGDLSGFDATEIAEACMWEGDADQFVEALVRAGFVDKLPDGRMEVHDWWEYAGRLLQRREQARERARQWRAQRKGGTQPQGVLGHTPTNAAECKDTTSQRTGNVQTTVPVAYAYATHSEPVAYAATNQTIPNQPNQVRANNLALRHTPLSVPSSGAHLAQGSLAPLYPDEPGPHGAEHDSAWQSPDSEADSSGAGSARPAATSAELAVGVETEDASEPDLNRMAREFFDYWCTVWKDVHPIGPRWTDQRRKKIKARLRSFSLEELKRACDNLHASPFARGDNDRGWVADLDYLIRSDEVVDRWLRRPDIQPPIRASPGKTPKLRLYRPKDPDQEESAA